MENEFSKLNKLYHYTSYDTALKILESRSLRFGRQNEMNDFNEFEKQLFGKGNPDSNGLQFLEALTDEYYKYRQLSFSIDDGNGRLGFDLHQMWGLYADKANGVCLVFDQDDILKRLAPDVYWDKNVYWDKITYKYHIESFINSLSKNVNNISDEIRHNIRDVFFVKRREWEHEQEFRILKRCSIASNEEYLNYGNALKYIIISSKYQDADCVLHAKKVNELMNKSKNVPILIYGNGFFEYSLIDYCINSDVYTGKEDRIWTSNAGYMSDSE